MTVIEELEREQISAILAKRSVPEFSPGDTVKVMVKVIEGMEVDPKDKRKAKEEPKGPGFRLQAYEGVVIARSGSGINESFTVRKISYGEGVERVFPIYSPYITEIEVLRRGKVRRAKRLNAAFKGFKRPKGDADDLTRIKGVDAELAARLSQLGAIKFEQIANFSDDDIANLDEALGLGGRIEKDDWIGQAQSLAAESAAAEVPAGDEQKAAAGKG